MDKAGIAKGMTVADIGAGEGYYTIRLAQRVGEHGRVLAEDIVASVRDALAERVAREDLENVASASAPPPTPSCPQPASTASSWSTCTTRSNNPMNSSGASGPRSSRRPVVVVDANRQTKNHGTPPALLKCEFEAVGYRQVAMTDMPSAGGYMATFKAVGPRRSRKRSSRV